MRPYDIHPLRASKTLKAGFYAVRRAITGPGAPIVGSGDEIHRSSTALALLSRLSVSQVPLSVVHLFISQGQALITLVLFSLSVGSYPDWRSCSDPLFMRLDDIDLTGQA